MLHSDQIEDLIMLVSSLDRDALLQHFHTYHASFPVDFTPEFLDALPLDKLRHIFVAICLQTQRMPETMPHAA